MLLSKLIKMKELVFLAPFLTVLKKRSSFCFLPYSDELMKMKDKTKKLEAVVHKRGLLDRETLTFQLQDAKDIIAARDRQIVVRALL